MMFWLLYGLKSMVKIDSPDASETVSRQAELARAEGQRIQARIDKKSKEQKSEGGRKRPMQAGTREYPSEFPAQHLRKHDSEAGLAFKPMFEAPGYEGSNKLKNMVALITGGNSGIGRAVATLFAREGADIAIAYLSSGEDAETTKAAIEHEGRTCLMLRGDVADSAFCAKAVKRVVDEFGKLDVLVSNAAFQQHVNDILDLSDEHFDRTVKTNLYGTFYMTRAAIPHIQPGGSIIMTGSVVAMRGSSELLDYSMTKGGIHTYARSLAAHLVDRGIRVNVVAPGPVWTSLNPEDRPAEDVKNFGSSTRMGRAAQPEEIAPAFVFLAAPSCASYITGEILPVVGGYDG
jgi:NAD(P)-dependent dehydrogenase (short-subunit alcohol dehydrogenase family)